MMFRFFLSLAFVFICCLVGLCQDAADELLGGVDDPEPTPTTQTNTPPPTDDTSASPPTDGTVTEPADAEGPTEVEAEAEDEPATEGGGFFGWIDDLTNTGALGLVRRGGVFMWPILLMAIIALGVLIERYRSLKMLNTDTSVLRHQVQQLVQADRVEDALQLCERSEGPVPAVLGTGLRKYLVLRRLKYDPVRIAAEVVKSMEDYSVHIVAALERHLPILGTIASVAPTLGFLGTVAGMITSFDDIQAKMGEMNIVEAAAGGISVALLTTCFGLIVGIPSFMAYNYFNSVINRNVLEVEETASELMEEITLQMALTKT